MDVATIVFTAI